MNNNNLNNPKAEVDIHNNDHDLEDIIIIDKEAVNSNKINSLLTIVALIIVLFIIIIVFVSDIDEDNKKVSVLEKNNSEIFAPELVLQSKRAEIKKDKVVEEKRDTNINDIIKNRLTETKSIDTGGVEVVSEVNIEKNISKVVKPTVKHIDNIEKEITNQVASDMLKTIKEAEKKEKVLVKKELKPLTTKEEVKPTLEVETEIKKESKKEVKKIEKKRIYKPKKTSVKKRVVISERYYVQVGAYRNTPSKRFISVIKNNGFKYKITNITANGTRKLLIGPYSSRSSVDKALVEVRDRITKSAFVVKQ